MRQRSDAGLIVAATAWAVLTSALTLARFYAGKTSLLDLGTFDQVLWNFLHRGAPLSTTNPPYFAQNWFGFHFSPVLLALAPFYALWPHPELLQIVQSLAFAAAGVVLFHALRAVGAQAREAWAGSLLYWINPFVLSAAVWDFHEIALATLFVALALWALAKRRFAPFCAALALLLLTKENYGLSVAGFGLAWALAHREWRRGGGLIALGLLAQGLIVLWIMPALHGGAHPMFDNSGTYLSRYGWLGLPWPERLATLAHLLFSMGADNISGVFYLFMLLFGGLMLPLFAPLMLAPGAGDLAANLLSASSMPRHFAAYHSAALIPVIVYAAFRGYRRLEAMPRLRLDLLRFALLMFALLIVAFDIAANPLRFWEIGLADAHEAADIAAVKRLLPPGPLVAQCNIGSFFSQRDVITPFPHGIERADAVVLQLADPYREAGDNRFNNPFGERPELFVRDLRAFLARPGWHIAYWQAPWLIMEPGGARRDESAERGEINRFLGRLSPQDNDATE